MRSTRDWFGDALVDVARADDRVVVVNCDLASATKTGKFKETFPERFFECGIAEANAIGVAAGLAQEGYRPFLASFGHFLTGKYLEIFQSIGLNDAGVVLVGTHAGLAIGKDGPTQMGLRDIALMRTLPNLQILHPADGNETAQMMAHLAGNRGPAYLRLCRQPQREVHDAGYRFEFGRPDVVHRGRRVAILTMGGLVGVLVDALPELARLGVNPTVVNVSTLPVDLGGVESLAAAHEHVFVIEDHFTTGGIADEVARIVAESDQAVHFGSWGVDDYGQAGSPEDLYARYELDTAGIARRIAAFARNNEEIKETA
jgi:transketolase